MTDLRQRLRSSFRWIGDRTDPDYRADVTGWWRHAEIRKDPPPGSDSDSWWETSTAPDYRNRHLDLGLRRSQLKSGEHVLFVDDWIATGAEATAVKQLVNIREL